jgi:diguanylate cyclase (GGDEF)-like protein
VLAVGYFAVPPARAVFVGALGLLVVFAIEYGLRRLQPPQPGGWRRLELALLLIAIGSVLLNTTYARPGAAVPYPSVADAFFTASYLAIAGGLYWIGRPQGPYRDETGLIDAVALTLAASLIAWLELIRPALVGLALSPAGRVTAVAGLVGFIAVVTGSIRLILSWRRSLAGTLLVLAVLSYVPAELARASQLVHGTYRSGTAVDAGYLAFAGLCGAAALTPSMPDVAAPVRARHTLNPTRLALLALGLLVAPAILVIEAVRGHIVGGVAIGVFGALVSLFILLRTSMTGIAYRRQAAREQAARAASQAMVSVTRPDEVEAGTRAALRAVLPEDAPSDVVLTQPYGLEDVALDGTVVMPLAGSPDVLQFRGPPAELAELKDLLRSLADQAAVALQRINLAEAAKAEERERYFRTLVVTSTDVILISRDGRVDYATPSADRVFGRDVRGERLEDLVHPIGSDQVEAAAGSVEATIAGPVGEITVTVHYRDLTQDPTVNGVVISMRDITAERRLQRDLAYRASHDELTGLINARAWGETMAREQDRRRELGHGIGALFVDIDNFKHINDSYGHAVGDQVLAETGRRIRDCLRTGDLAARVGGDEFALLLLGLNTVDDARAVAERLSHSLTRPTRADGKDIDCKASIGLAYTEDKEQVQDLVRHADTALYTAKSQGKARWTEYERGQRGRFT